MPNEVPASGPLTVDQAAVMFASEVNPKREPQEVASGGEVEAPESGESESLAADDEAEVENAEEAEAPEATESEEKPKYRVKVDGEEYEVTLDELISGHQRDADYRRKTAALAEKERNLRAEVETSTKAERDAVAQQREQYKSVLDVWTKQISSVMPSDEELETLRQSGDALGYATKVAQKMQIKDQLAQWSQETERLAKEDQAKKDSERQAHIAREGELLLKAIPAWKDEAKHKADLAQIFDYASKSLELTSDEWNSLVMTSHKAMVALRDAAAFRALQANKPAIQKQVEAVQTVKPGSAAQQPSKASKAARARQSLAKTGTLESAAEAFKHLLG